MLLADISDEMTVGGGSGDDLTPAERREKRDGPFGPNNPYSRLVMMLALPGVIRMVKERNERVAKGRTSSLLDSLDDLDVATLPEGLRGIHGDYDGTDFDPNSFQYADLPGFRLAWLIGVCRREGVQVFRRDGVPRIDPGKSPSPMATAAVNWLKRYREQVVSRLAAGKEFDSREWQLELLFGDAQGWQVWGYSTEDGRGADHGDHLQPGEVPGYIDRVTIWRRGAWKWLGSHAMTAGVWVMLPRMAERP